MKKISIAAGLLLGIAFASHAQVQTSQNDTSQQFNDPNQGSKTPEQIANHRTDVLARRLNLNPDQANKIYGILLNEIIRVQQIRSGNPGNGPGTRSSIRGIKLDAESQIRALLTDDQFRAYQSLKGEQRNRALQKRQWGNGVPAN